MMKITLPIEPLFILFTLKQAGYDGYIVGGAVRDLLQGTSSNDVDLTTNAQPEQIKALFPESFYENEFGTVSITPKHTREQAGLAPVEHSTTNNETVFPIDVKGATKLHQSLTSLPEKISEPTSAPPYEITTYRSDGTYNDHRRPEAVTWGETLEEDLQRRDFTINALALTVDDALLKKLFGDTPPDTVELTESNFTIIDPHQGQADLQAKVIRTVGDASERFYEDALRMLRAVRFAVQLNFNIDRAAYDAIKQHADLLQHISGERIRDEFLKMLASDHPKQAIELLEETGLLATVLPELLKAKGVEQSGHHTTDVWTHSLDSLEATPSQDPIVRLATLIHDISKPDTFEKTETGAITFYNHEIVGSRVAKKIAERLKLSKKDIERVFILVRFHMFHYQPENTDASIRRFMRKVGLENLNDILDVREADRLGSGARKTSWRLEEMKQRMAEQLHQPFDVTDLAIDGHDIMSELKIKPGPIIGTILSGLLEEVLEKPELNTKDILLTRARALATQKSDQSSMA